MTALDTATLSSLLSACDDTASTAPHAWPPLLAVASAALLNADESYVSDSELKRGRARLQPVLELRGPHSDVLEQLAAKLDACRASFESLPGDSGERKALLRAPVQQRAIDAFLAGTRPCIVLPSTPPPQAAANPPAHSAPSAANAPVPQSLVAVVAALVLVLAVLLGVRR